MPRSGAKKRPRFALERSSISPAPSEDLDDLHWQRYVASEFQSAETEEYRSQAAGLVPQLSIGILNGCGAYSFANPCNPKATDLQFDAAMTLQPRLVSFDTPSSFPRQESPVRINTPLNK